MPYFFQSGKEALGFTAFMLALLAVVATSATAVTAGWINPIWMFHPVFLFLFLFTIIPASWNRGAFWPCHPRVLLGSLIGGLTTVGLFAQFWPAS